MPDLLGTLFLGLAVADAAGAAVYAAWRYITGGP